jgi:hypothetical protein
MLEYKQNYVKFFRHRNELEIYKDFEDIKKQILHDDKISGIISELQNWPCYEIQNHKKVDLC